MGGVKVTELKELFKPAVIGKMELRNRIIMAPFEKSYATPRGEVTLRYIDYLAERAKGGAGLILVESMCVDPVGRLRIRQLNIDDDRLIPGLKRLADAVHAHGAKIGSLIAHGGRQTATRISGFQPVAPSPVPSKTLTGGDMPRELTVSEIKQLVQRFADAARRTKEAGWDLVEVHGAHGYLVGQFLSPVSNKRTDEYGGSFENRMRFPLEVVAAVREAVGDDFPVGYRMSADEFVENGLTLGDTVPFAKRLEAAGIDLIDVSGGIYESVIHIVQPASFPRGYLVPLAEAVKSEVSVPVTVAGRINDPDLANELLQERKTDFVSFARAFHIDPHFPRKALEGRVEDVFRCPACMVCSDRLATQLPVICALNPAASRERKFAIKAAAEKKSVVVAGGGPAGMEAARVAALRGHDVVLYEKEDELGGLVRFISTLPGQGEYAEIIRYLSTQIEKAGVEVHLGQPVTPELLEQIQADVTIMAMGSSPVVPLKPGVDKGHVYTALDVLAGIAPVGSKAVVLGGSAIGCGTATYLAEKGSHVVIVEPTDQLAPTVGLRGGWVLRKTLEEDPNVETRLGTTLEKIMDDSVMVQSNGQHEEITGVDMVVLAVGMAENSQLAETLQAHPGGPEVYRIGDCKLPRGIEAAIYEAGVVGRQI
jgi:2,4-dienoyl-CoA reductase-like NADH-dependent reductase (Old Yellow Enzyme family)/thioredoxin reductase